LNDASRYDPSNKIGVTTEQIGKILVDRKLSKKTIIESPNKLKRARDHALNCSILGLSIPIPHGNSFRYTKSPVANLLSKYSFENECPYDLHESAIFVDRMMKLKLTNAYDSRKTYSKFHTRPFLSLLTILKHGPLHLSQVHYLLSIHNDLNIHPKLTTNLLETFSKYRPYDEDKIECFIKDFKLSDKRTQKEIGRSTKPLLDWAQQGNLLTADKAGWCLITENGKATQEFYSKYFPVWYDQLGLNAPLQSALLLLYQYGYQNNLRVNRRKLPKEYREALDELISKYKIWNKSITKLEQPIDFSLDYDVPYKQRKEVEEYALRIVSEIQFPKVDLYSISLQSIYQLENILEQTPTELKWVQLNKALGIKIPRRECFQTDLEWEVCIRLQVFQLPALPYQGEFEGETDLPMATDNPDIVIKNAIKCLVECKSSKEWGEVVKLSKRIGGELLMYQTYAEDIGANSALFVCSVKDFHQKDFIQSFSKRGSKLNKIVLVNWAFLEEARQDRRLLTHFINIITDPQSVKPSEKILVST
jgi:hypothetical protein